MHKECSALLTAVKREGPKHPNAVVLMKVDASATKGAVLKGKSSSPEMAEMIEELWEEAIKSGWVIRITHISGDEMVRNGTDGYSRLHEFRLAHRLRMSLWGKWGKPSLDLWSSPKMRVLEKFCCIGGGGGSMGDARVVSLKGEKIWAVPPLTMIEFTLQRMEEAKVKGIVVVPLWRTQSFYAWRMKASEERVLPWGKKNSAERAIIQYGDGSTHVMNRYQFVAWYFEFDKPSKPAPCFAKPPVSRGAQPTWCDVGKRKREHGTRKQPFRIGMALASKGKVVLSIFDGIGGGLLSLRRAGIEVSQYWRLEWCPECNSVVAAQGDPAVRNCGVMDVKAVFGTEVGEHWPVWASVDVTLVAFPCQDVARSNPNGPGMEGNNSSHLVYAIRIMRAIMRVNKRMKFFLECVAGWNKRGQAHLPWVNSLLGVGEPRKFCSSVHSYCNRERFYWANWGLPKELARASAPAADILDKGCVAVNNEGVMIMKLRTLMTRTNSWSTKLPILELATNTRRAVRPHEAEAAMELPVGYTKVYADGSLVPDATRIKMVGNGWNIRTTTALLASGAHLFGGDESETNTAMNTTADVKKRCRR